VKRLLTFGSIFLIALAVAIAAAMHKTEHRVQIKTYLRDAAGIRTGARVDLAGIKIGEVESVRARPELKDSPAEIVMSLRTDYALDIPSDAVVSLASAGLLGETFAAIDVANTSGAPIGNGAVLKSAPMQALSSQELLDRISEILKAKGCESEPGPANNSQHPTSPQKRK